VLIRHVLGLPVTAAVVDMASLEELRPNVPAARDFAPLGERERESLEKLMA